MNICGQEFTAYDFGCLTLVLLLGGAACIGIAAGIIFLLGALNVS